MSAGHLIAQGDTETLIVYCGIGVVVLIGFTIWYGWYR
jgi:uncharacterized membrane protein